MTPAPIEHLHRLSYDLGKSIWQSYRKKSKEDFETGEAWLTRVLQDHGVERWPTNTEDWEPWAKQRVGVCMTIREYQRDESTAAQRMQDYFSRFGISLRAKIPEAIIRRALHIDWWRKRGRTAYSRASEEMAFNLGLVTNYISDGGLTLRREQKIRNRRILSRLQVTNEDDYSISLLEAHDRSVSNPAVRRAELMVRIKGMEEIAMERSLPGVFLTLTAPSHYHRKSGRWSGVTPRQTQQYLTNLWSRIRAALERAGVDYFGIRVTEPHKDGTPHWHLLCWCAPEHQDALIRIMRGYALAEAPDEPGAQEHRFKVEYMRTGIDPKTGRPLSAISYIAKYISKNVDGFGINEIYDTTSEGKIDPVLMAKDEAVERIEAWARVWGIRQFQQFGSAPVTVWRELRRVDSPIRMTSPIEKNMPIGGMTKVNAISIENKNTIEIAALNDAHGAADRGDWAGYVKAIQKAPIAVEKMLTGAVNVYGELVLPSIVGIRCGDFWVKSRIHTWRLERVPNLPSEKFIFHTKRAFDVLDSCQ